MRGDRSADRPGAGRPAPPNLPVIPLPVPEKIADLEGRWAAANFFAAFAIGAVLSRAAFQGGFRWWFLNLPVALFVAATGSLGGSATTFGARRLWPIVLGRDSSREQRFWARFVGSSVAAGYSFDVLMSRLEGRAVWRGTYGWWWTIAWPLAALMLFVNATEVEAAGRHSAERRALMNDRTSLKNHYALDADLAELARLQILFTFVYLDLDGFKAVNDRIGHKAGDEVLAETAAVLSRVVPVAYHLHGDEFAFLMSGRDETSVEQLVRQVFNGIRRIGERRAADLGATFGAASSEAYRDNPDGVRHEADAQMRRAKDSGRRRLAFGTGRLVDLTRT